MPLLAVSQAEIDGADNITWYRASPEAERGFCSICGSHLFWKAGHRYAGTGAKTSDIEEVDQRLHRDTRRLVR